MSTRLVGDLALPPFLAPPNRLQTATEGVRAGIMIGTSLFLFTAVLGIILKPIAFFW
jgi:hypothetical protein